ncbi:MAG: tripartite tricarboxylate transporter substrate binding protein [Burkholderiales bacterium]|jgi:tripartite-type tricarboxylate transporter receptor subunit TctC
MTQAFSRRSFHLALAAGAAALAAPPARAGRGVVEDVSAYPSKQITIVVGFPPGGPTDILARLVARNLADAWGRPVVVENKPGAGSNIATEQVVRADSDGYVLLLQTIANATNTSIYKGLKFDAQRDLAPIVQLMASPSVLVVNPAVPAKSLGELIALAKAKPGTLSFASTGTGGSPHLAGEMLKMRTGIDIVHVPYKGATPALNDVLAGTVSMGFMTLLGVVQHMQSGRLRPLAVAGQRRLAELPDVPTTAELGLADFLVLSWNGLAAPAGTPRPVIDKLNREVNRILQLPEVRRQLEALGAEPGGGGVEDYTRFIQAETVRWAAVVKSANVSLD